MKVKKAVILAAGFGTRMLPATKTIPKEMLPIVAKPIIHYIMEEIVFAGIKEVIIITSRDKTAMEDYFDYAPELEDRLAASGKETELSIVRAAAEIADIHYIRQMEMKGSGHALYRAKAFIGDEPFAVLLGDDIMKSTVPVIGQLAAAAERTDAACVGIQEVSPDVIHKYCTLGLDHVEDRLYDVKDIIEKPRPDQVITNYAMLGRYVLTPAIFDILETLPAGYGGEIWLTDAINVLCKRERVTALDFEGRRYDAGNLCGFLEITMDFALEHPDLAEFMRNYIINKAKELCL